MDNPLFDPSPSGDIKCICATLYPNASADIKTPHRPKDCLCFLDHLVSTTKRPRNPHCTGRRAQIICDSIHRFLIAVSYCAPPDSPIQTLVDSLRIPLVAITTNAIADSYPVGSPGYISAECRESLEELGILSQHGRRK